MRRALSAPLAVVAGLLLLLAVVANWASSTVFDSQTFSERAVEPLGSQLVRRELAHKLTEQLVRSGNQQAISFRPGFEVAIEGVIDTDTFRSIFRNAVRRTHESILAGRGGGGLNLGDSFAIITSSLQLSSGAQSTGDGAKSLDNSLSDVTRSLDDLGVWDLEDTINLLGIVCLIGALAAAAGSVAAAGDRRRAVRRLGFTLVVVGGAVALLLVGLRWWAGRQIDDPSLADAIGAALGRVTDDLRITGLWIAAYGVVIAAAAAGSDVRYTPAEVWRRTRAWIERRRRTTAGTLVLGALGVLISILLIQEPLGNLEIVVRAVGLWIGYLAVAEVLRLVRAISEPAGARRSIWPRVAIAGAVGVVLIGVTFAFVLSTRRAADAAVAEGEQACNGRTSLCDLRIDQVTFPGTHNAMSSSLYPGFLFGEQIDTISGQLNGGVRALLIDTHYGIPSSARLPGAASPLVLTDQVAEATDRTAERPDSAAAKRAAQLAARAPRAAEAHRGIYLCHNHCELGAVPFETPLSDVKTFLETHPDDVVILIIQDATSPADSAAAIKAAGLSDRVATLHHDEPLPTLRSLIDRGRTLLVFAERGAPGGPPWYHSAYEWFQETGYEFKSVDDFDCRANRGPATAPLFLLNHWVSSSPPDPAAAAAANAHTALERRIVRCIAERGVVPNVVAVDFASRGDLVSTVQSINSTKVREERARRRAARPPAQGAPPPPVGTITTEPVTPGAPLPAEATVIRTLTGGDAARFCPALPRAVAPILAWAEAILSDAPTEAGITDLVYAPLLERRLAPYVESAPNQLASLAEPLLERARAATETLQALGLGADDVRRLEQQAADALGSPDSPDGVTIRQSLAARLRARVDPDRLSAAALVFTAGQSDPAELLDLGFVPPEVGAASGFPCAPILATI